MGWLWAVGSLPRNRGWPRLLPPCLPRLSAYISWLSLPFPSSLEHRTALQFCFFLSLMFPEANWSLQWLSFLDLPPSCVHFAPGTSTEPIPLPTTRTPCAGRLLISDQSSAEVERPNTRP